MRRRIGAIFAITGLVIALTGASTAANAATQEVDYGTIAESDRAAADDCLSAIRQLNAGDKAKQKKITTDDPIEFSCVGETASMNAAGNQRKKVTTSPAGHKGKSSHTAGPELYGFWYDPGDPPEQYIDGPYRGSVMTTVFYGKINDPVTGSWILGINMQLTGDLKTNFHDFDYMWFHSEYSSIVFSAFIKLQKMNGILPPTTEDWAGVNNGPAGSTGEEYTGCWRNR